MNGMKRFLALMLAAALALSLVACGGGGGETPSDGSSAPGESPQAPQTPEKERVIPGTYEAVSLVSAAAYVLNENGSFDSGEQKGTYTAADNGSRITFQFKDSSSSSTLIAYGEYYHTEAKMTEDTEYGLAPSFDDAGRSNQTFTTQAGDVSLTLELHEDGSFTFSTDKQSPVFDKFRDVVTYKGSYSLEDTVLNLNWNGIVYPFLVSDEVIYPVVYTKQTDANSGDIAAAQTAIQTAEEEAAENRWWTPADETTTTAVKAALIGDDGSWGYWVDSDERHSLAFSTIGVSVNGAHILKSYSIHNGAILLEDENRRKCNVIPYVYTDENLTLYEMLSMDKEGLLDAAADLTAISSYQAQKTN